MKMNQFRSILAITVVAISITTNLLPAQAFTWDDLWNTVKKGVEKGFNDAVQSQSEQPTGSNSESTEAAPASASVNPPGESNSPTNSSEPPQSDGDIDATPIE